jgi:hypothetical protein
MSVNGDCVFCIPTAKVNYGSFGAVFTSSDARRRLPAIVMCMFGITLTLTSKLCKKDQKFCKSLLGFVDSVESSGVVSSVPVLESLTHRKTTKLTPFVVVTVKNVVPCPRPFTLGGASASFVRALGSETSAAALAKACDSHPAFFDEILGVVLGRVKKESVVMCSDKRPTGFHTMAPAQIQAAGCEKMYRAMQHDLRTHGQILCRVLHAAAGADMGQDIDMGVLASAAGAYKHRSARVCLFQTLQSLLLRGEHLTKEGLERLAVFQGVNSYKSTKSTAYEMSIDPVLDNLPWKTSVEAKLNDSALALVSAHHTTSHYIAF